MLVCDVKRSIQKLSGRIWKCLMRVCIVFHTDHKILAQLLSSKATKKYFINTLENEIQAQNGTISYSENIGECGKTEFLEHLGSPR